MQEKRYMISDAAKTIDVEPHVLRYWEEELGIEIPRNEMQHRYYRQEDVDTLISVKELKEKGFQLKAIKLLLPDIRKVEALDQKRLIDLRDKLDVAMGLTEIEVSTGSEKGEKELLQKELDNLSDKEQQKETNYIHIVGSIEDTFREDGEYNGPLDCTVKKADCPGELLSENISISELGQAEEKVKIESGIELAGRTGDQEEASIQNKEIAEHLERSSETDRTDNITVTMDKPNGQIAEADKDNLEKRDSDLPADNNDKMVQFRKIMCGIMMEALQENNIVLSKEISNEVTGSVVKELDYLMRIREEREEEHYKQLDRTLREYQQGKQQVAATKEMTGKKKKSSKFFKKNNVKI